MTDENPNSDLASMDFVALTLEYERLKEKGRQAALSSDSRAAVAALDDNDLRRLTAIIQIKRRLSGGQPKESGAKKPASTRAKKPVATEADLLNL